MHHRLLKPESRFDAAILAAGDFPKGETALEILKKTSPLVVCDSALENVVAYNKIHSTHILPAAVVGDGDSLHSEYKKQYAHLWHQYDEQEYNDLTKATRFSIEHYGPKTIAYIGATGKREDHTIANISLMAYYLQELHVEPIMVTDYGWFTAASGLSTFESFEGQQASIFNINCKNLSGEGLVWNPYTYSQLWQGTLNEARGSMFSLNGDGTYIVFQTFKKKIRAK